MSSFLGRGEAGSDRVTEAAECGEELPFLDPVVLSRSVAMLGVQQKVASLL